MHVSRELLGQLKRFLAGEMVNMICKFFHENVCCLNWKHDKFYFTFNYFYREIHVFADYLNDSEKFESFVKRM